MRERNGDVINLIHPLEFEDPTPERYGGRDLFPFQGRETTLTYKQSIRERADRDALTNVIFQFANADGSIATSSAPTKQSRRF